MTRITTNKSTTLQKVASMVHDRQAEQLAAEFGLVIQNVSWEDCARDKQSVWGPCISDMTLQVDNTPLPVIRLPNFTDVTWDQPMKNIPLNVGNEKGKNLKQISLHEYLANVPNSGCRSLLAPSRDSHVIMSSQACFLPIEEGKDTKFNVCLHNYQSYPNNPAVLVIIASSSGTSAQIVDQSSQTLYFNKNGEKASFVAQRLKDQRRERGEQIEGEMTAEEKSDNMLLIIQVPVKQKDMRRRVPEKLRRKAKAKPMAMACESALCDVDEAMISVGDSEGKFSELKSARIERDERFPVRVTLQYYKATSNGVINDQVVEQIAVQMVTARSFAAHNEIGSLVTSDSTEKPRPTEAHSVIPLWWNSFWRDNYYLFPDMSENQAKKLAFTNSHITSMKFPDAKKEALSILQRSIKPSRPLWDPSVPF